ncbi:hypothetical protein LGK95_08500 [Clostridium algoriphilum]|uniref:hypothetical protein n=1 Tax=Clostridium algoriphilum TaxID=198347 RepID=UPI001CF5F746|nr:hypothetical protein [Clostridium algoriphilum]MCB2293560.1 hypothetical protein [Clostridium algoriphilum]
MSIKVEKTKKNTDISNDNMSAIANDAESKVTGQSNTDFTDFTDKKHADSLTNADLANVAIMNDDVESNTADTME